MFYLWKNKKTHSRFGKWHEEYGKFSIEHFKSVETRTLMESFCPGWKMNELKNYRGVMCDDTEERWKIWIGIELRGQK